MSGGVTDSSLFNKCVFYNVYFLQWAYITFDIKIILKVI